MTETFVLLLALAVGVSGQNTTEIFVPDDQPSVGLCSSGVLTSAFTSTTLAIPASRLDPAYPVVEGIALAPCTTTTWTALAVSVIVGNLATGNPLGAPGVVRGTITNPGQFADDAVLAWNAELDGGFSFALTADTWSPVPLAATGRAVWDGVSDLGIHFIYVAGSSTETFRSVVGGALVCFGPISCYQGPRVRLTMSDRAPPSATFVGTSCGAGGPVTPAGLHIGRLPWLGSTFRIACTGMPASMPKWLFLAGEVITPGIPLSANCPLYLDPITASAFISAGVGPFPGDSFTVPAWDLALPNDPSLAGAVLGLQATPGPTPLVQLTTNALRIVLQ